MSDQSSLTSKNNDDTHVTQQWSKKAHIEVDLTNLPMNLGLHPPISTYH